MSTGFPWEVKRYILYFLFWAFSVFLTFSVISVDFYNEEKKSNACYEIKIQKHSFQRKRVLIGWVAPVPLSCIFGGKWSSCDIEGQGKNSMLRFSWCPRSYLWFLEYMLAYSSLTSSKLFACPSSRLKEPVGEWKAKVQRAKSGLCRVSSAFLAQAESTWVPEPTPFSVRKSGAQFHPSF